MWLIGTTITAIVAMIAERIARGAKRVGDRALREVAEVDDEHQRGRNEAARPTSHHTPHVGPPPRCCR